MEGILYREMQPEDVSSALALRNEVFPDALVSQENWEQDEMLASIALLEDEVVGAIPLVLREIVIAPGVKIVAAFENSVGTREELRSQGIGRGMIAEACEFLKGRADALFVYRGDERSDGYRFYATTNHYNLLYSRHYHYGSPETSYLPPGVTLAGKESIFLNSERLEAVFNSTYGRFGGYPRRQEGYWQRALASSIYSEFPTDFSFVHIIQSDELLGYAICGARTTRHNGMADILEMATLGADLSIAQRILTGVASVAGERKLGVDIQLSNEDPFLPLFQANGYLPDPRGTIVMGQILDVPEFFEKHWSSRFELYNTSLVVVTPKEDYVLIEPEVRQQTVTLEMSEEMLHRWLVARLDLRARLDEGSATAYGASSQVIERVCDAIPCTPWAYHFIDWI
jgi:predicted N-acetyltransferase YhbS